MNSEHSVDWFLYECGDWQTQESGVFIPVWVMV
jgi:hypothetical protein